MGTEVAIKLSTATATGGKEQLTLSGTTDVGGYVYCGVSKTASARMLADATATKTATDATATKTTTDATATKTDATATTTTATPAVAKITNLQSAAAIAKFNVQRAETKKGALSFSLVFTGLTAGKTYAW